MGCDIHLYIEYRPKGVKDSHWMGFGGRINPGRDYHMFALLAGVRAMATEPIYTQRGYPSDAGYSAAGDAYMYIDDKIEDIEERRCPRFKAEEWVINGLSKFVDDHYVTHPDYHSHSWLTDYEFERVLIASKDAGAEYWAVLASMKALEEHGKYDTRVVFWFDN